MPPSSALDKLSLLLRGADAEPIVVPDRIAISTIYDLQYRVVVIACAYRAHAESDLLGVSCIPAAKLKLVQFVAIRPWLLQTVREWVATRHEAQFETLHAHTIRRGYLGDATHDRVIDYLVAREVLVRAGGQLVSGLHYSTIANLAATAESDALFEQERATIDELRSVRITAVMLEDA